MSETLPPKIRTFIAVFPPSEIAERLAKVQSAPKKALSDGSVAWTRPEQIHLTLNFLGNIESERLLAFGTALSTVSRQVSHFHLECVGLGAFPTVRNPRIVWAGLIDQTEPLQKLKKLLDVAMEELGIVPEERAFHPHFTIGRVKFLGGRDRKYIGELLEKSATEVFGSWEVERIDLMRSQLTPHGSFYSVLKSFPLASTEV